MKTCCLSRRRLPRITVGMALSAALFAMACIYAQMAAALLQTFNQPVSLGSGWEALASSNGPATLRRHADWQAPYVAPSHPEVAIFPPVAPDFPFR
jgi:hypothetical protein